MHQNKIQDDVDRHRDGAGLHRSPGVTHGIEGGGGQPHRRIGEQPDAVEDQRLRGCYGVKEDELAVLEQDGDHRLGGDSQKDGRRDGQKEDQLQ